MMNILNGGAHADTSVDFQEFARPSAPIVCRALRATPISPQPRDPEETCQSTGVGDRRLRAEPEPIAMTEVVLEAVGASA
jgi:hypothetical protein